ncbi:signal transduction histidine kinase [Dethiosulfovibrio peptidovorans DSM 11002]|uniref:histidine kinase n=1 Tax=Dethiosulfovibrio peptidovorans DSM 11002 TaxID=469381 RepID=D2Z595_9BACT|nr:histidine kinase dimerization/phosphoacceptor domain -containing protein [Dethiosulfovibrio peptidovorans]EFC90654.1 signal transduction histidine kinase [Dethiosulfovibrio peptidovorans DSM 11002]
MKDISQSLVMVVDDSRAFLDLMVELLSPICRVSVALDGPSCLALAEREPPDLFLMDVQMPGMSGFDVCRVLKSDQALRHIPVMFVSSINDMESRIKGLSLGAVDYVVKPFFSQELLLRVEAHLNLKIAQESLVQEAEYLEEQVRRRTEEIRAATRRIEASEREFRSLAEGLPDMVFRIGPDGRFRSISGAVRSLLGVDPGEALGRTPEDSGLSSLCIALSRENLMRVFQKGDQEVMEVPLLEGGTVEVRLLPERGPDDSKVISVLGIIRDISSQRMVEEQLLSQGAFLSTLVDNLPVGVTAKDLSVGGAYVIWNSKLSQVLEIPAEEALGMTEGDLFPSELADIMVRDDRKAFETGRPVVTDLSYDVAGPDGLTARFFRVTRVPITDDEGAPSILLAMVEDRTDFVIADRELKSSLHDKDILLQEVHHRVKNNLQVVSSLMSLQASRSDDPTVVSAFLESRSRVLAMAYVHELLYRNSQFSDIKFADYLDELTGIISSTYGDGRDISLEVEADDTRLHVDVAIPCGLIVNELVTNAYKHAFSGRESGTVKVDFRSENGNVSLIVSDDGVGCDDLDKEDSLGLTVVRGLVRQIGGGLVVLSDRGMSFEVSFPFKRGAGEMKEGGRR